MTPEWRPRRDDKLHQKLPYTFGVRKEFFGVDLMSSLVCFGVHFCQSQRWHRFRHGHFCRQQMCALLQQRCAFLSAAVCISVSGVHSCQRCAFLSAVVCISVSSVGMGAGIGCGIGAAVSAHQK